VGIIVPELLQVQQIKEISVSSRQLFEQVPGKISHDSIL
jgi:hypothetical protein